MLCHATGKSETHFPIVYRYNLLMYFSPCCVPATKRYNGLIMGTILAQVRSILNNKVISVANKTIPCSNNGFCNRGRLAIVRDIMVATPVTDP